MKCCTPAWLRCGSYLNLKSDVGDRIVEKSMKENRKKVTLVLKGIIQNILKIISTVWLIRSYLIN